MPASWLRSVSPLLISALLAPAVPAQFPGLIGTSGNAPAEGQPDRRFTLRPFLSLLGTYSHSLTPSSVDVDKIADADSYGGMVQFGAGGFKAFRHSLLGLEYSGSYRHYARYQRLNGVDQALALQFSHRLSRRLSLALNEAAGIRNTGFTLGGASLGMGLAALPHASSEVLPGLDIFDTRTYHAMTAADVTFRKNLHWSLSGGASGFLVRRKHASLANLNGASARGSTAYQVARNHSLGIGYSFTRFDFGRAFGDSNIHTAVVQYVYQPERDWLVSAEAGGYRVENLRERAVQLDPLLALLLGQRTGIEVFHGTSYGPIGRLSATRRFRRSSASASYTLSVHPGNGVYLTSRRSGLSGGWSYTGFRRISFRLSASENRMSAMTQALSTYRHQSAGAHASYRLSFVHLTGGALYRHVKTGTFDRDGYNLSLGLSFGFGDLPLPF